MEEQLKELRHALEKAKEKFIKYLDEEDSDKSKSACDEICKLADTAAKIENLESQQEIEKKKISLEKWRLGITVAAAAVGGFVGKMILQKDEQKFRRNMSRETWMNERDGVIMSPTGKYWNSESVKK